MNKLELKHIVGYLPYGLKVKNQFGIFKVLGVRSECSSNNNLMLSYKFGDDYLWGYSYENKPILRPMTDLVKEINGVVHAIELAKIKMEHNPLRYTTVDKNGEIMLKCKLITKPFGKVIKVLNGDAWVVYISLSKPERLFTYFTNYLYKNHFDIYGLIEQNLAIDINTL